MTCWAYGDTWEKGWTRPLGGGGRESLRATRTASLEERPEEGGMEGGRELRGEGREGGEKERDGGKEGRDEDS